MTLGTAWEAGRLDTKRGQPRVLFGRMYEDAARQPPQGAGKPAQPGQQPQGGGVKTTETQKTQQQHLESGGIQ